MSKYSITNQQLQALVDHLLTQAPKTTFTVAGKAFLASKVVALAQSLLTARAAIAAAKGALANARTADSQLEIVSLPVVASVRVTLASMLSNDESALADLAVAPRKARKALSLAERLTIAEKVRATRAARGTMGPKQKAKVKGNVTGVIVTPVTSQGTATTSAAASANVVATVPTSTSPPATASPSSTANLAAEVGALPASLPVTAPVAATGGVLASAIPATAILAVAGTPTLPGH